MSLPVITDERPDCSGVPVGGPIEARVISDQVASVASGHHIRTAAVGSAVGLDRPHHPLEGRFGVDLLPGGPALRHAHLHNRYDMTCSARLMPSVKLILVMGGTVDVRFGERSLEWRADQPPQGAVVHLSNETLFERRARRGTWEHSLTLTLPHAWLAQRLGKSAAVPACGDTRASRDVRVRSWEPSESMLVLAQSLLDNDRDDDPSRPFRCESVALAMFAEALPAVSNVVAGAAPASVSDARRARQIREVIDRRDAARMTLDGIAQELGMSAANLQRHFQSLYGTSVQRFIRQRRLQAAHDALRYDGVRVSEAAEIAGYGNPANFATAFRRHFGVAPSRLGKTWAPGG